MSRIAPTGQGVLAQRQALLSDDAAGGSADVDEAFRFTASGLGLPAAAPTSQGWHLKVAVRPNGSRGAVSKTLWLKCGAPAASVRSRAVVAPLSPTRALRQPVRPVQAAPPVSRQAMAKESGVAATFRTTAAAVRIASRSRSGPRPGASRLARSASRAISLG